jgi:lysophospholipase L1-like esterase
MSHVVLIGDSIFDNASYVPNQPCLVEQLRRTLASGWTATLAAVDGAITSDVESQLRKVPTEVTHFALSVGGNDALMASHLLREPSVTVGEAMLTIGATLDEFEQGYRQMLTAILKLRKPLVACTVYDAIPGLELAERTALRGFNEIITRTLFAAGLPLIDLRLLCRDYGDYSTVSAIEPSARGGAKIAEAIAEVVQRHDFAGRPVVYG